jgi:hypothetical protein
VPKARFHTSGTDWALNSRTGKSLSLGDFYIAQPSATAATLNRELARGKNLILTPGSYNLDAPLQINRPDTVVLGLGFPQVNAVAGTAAVKVGNVPGVSLSGLEVGGGTSAAATADTLVQIGTPGVRSGVAANPTTLNDVHIASSAVTAETISQNHVLVDESWIRAGNGSTWTDSAGSHGVVVNGNDVT